ncbi:unnamed protein product [Hydatigera taeniaeformis]|uniref:Thyroglobulin type-1 domain-containing protein n=1 Tax=Hydatigena taeniaeformis TaxID=6205 RepID=A0A3P7EPD0_HYDTA|nr:unnamed protein product [Hydatigera taeniaeformis]
MALRVRQDFPSLLPHASLFDGKEVAIGSEFSAGTFVPHSPPPSPPPLPLPSPPSLSTSRIAFTAESLPACRMDRPDLYEARQCNALDCFCVNVTTGVFLPGTRTSIEDLVDCSTGRIKTLFCTLALFTA